MIHKPLKITKIQHQIIEGLLLSDATLYQQSKRGYRFSLKQKLSRKQFVEHIKNKLKFNTQVLFSKHFLKETKKWYDECAIYKSNIVFENYYNRWYPKGKKIVPEDLELTPISTLYWYLGDGCISYNDRCIWLYTNSFTIKEVKKLICQLKNLNMVCNLQRSNKKAPIIYISTKSTKNFLDYMGLCPIKCFDYKWNYKPYIFIVNKKFLVFKDNKIVIEYVNQSQCARDLNLDSSHISQCLKQKRKSHKGYTFEYVK